MASDNRFTPWLMAQTWRHVLFAHWPVDPALVQASLPAGIVADTFEGKAWLSVVPFQLTYTLRGFEWLPVRQTFTELNLRTYVRKGSESGVYFYTLEASDWASVQAAQRLFHLPYRLANLDLRQHSDGQWHFLGTRSSGPLHVELSFTPKGVADPAEPIVNQALARFLTERYRLFTTDLTGNWHTVPIWHSPWTLQPVDVDIQANTLLKAFGFADCPALTPAVCHYADYLPVKTGLVSRC